MVLIRENYNIQFMKDFGYLFLFAGVITGFYEGTAKGDRHRTVGYVNR